MSELAKKLYAVLGLGKFGSNSHPIHPSTVHFPIAFFTTANSLNLLYGLAIYFPSLSPITPDKFNTGALTILGYFANVAGLVTSIPALLTGNAELYAMVQSRGLWVTDQETETRSLEPVVKVTLLHAALNDIAVMGAVYNWLMERNRAHEDYRPYGHQIVLSAGAIGLTLFAAYLGGGLVYKHGVGVQRMGDGLEEKKKEQKELLEKSETSKSK